MPNVEYCRSDRHGHERWWYRIGKGPRTALPAWGTAEFLSAWQTAHQAAQSGTKMLAPIGAVRTRPGSLSAALAGYYASPLWNDHLAPGTRQYRRPILEKLRARHGDASMATLKCEHLQPLFNKLTPNAQKHWMKALRGLMAFCLQEKLIKTDPTVGVIRARPERSDGHLAFSEDDVETYRHAHPLGTRERLALEIMLNLGLRRSDACRIGPLDIKGGWLRDFTPKKTSRTTGVRINLPVHPDLAAAIAAMKTVSTKTYLLTDKGQPFASEASFGMWMRKACDKAGLTEVSSHGLRKSAAIRLAYAGAQMPELMKVFGWRSPSQAQVYIDQADAMRLAAQAMAKLEAYQQLEANQKANKVSPTLDPGLGKK